MDLHTKNKRIAYVGVFVCIALVFSYVEVLLPIDFGIPGMKLGLANIVTVIALYLFGKKWALFISILRVVLSALLFTSFFSMIYSLSGALLSLAIMSMFYNRSKLSMTGISMLGGVFHNVGQLIVACIIVKQIKLSFYGPVLILSGLITGLIIGIVSISVYKRVETYVRL